MGTVSDSFLVGDCVLQHSQDGSSQTISFSFLFVGWAAGRRVKEEVGRGRGKERTSAYVYSHLKQIYLQSFTLFLCL